MPRVPTSRTGDGAHPRRCWSPCSWLLRYLWAGVIWRGGPDATPAIQLRSLPTRRTQGEWLLPSYFLRCWRGADFLHRRLSKSHQESYREMRAGLDPQAVHTIDASLKAAGGPVAISTTHDDQHTFIRAAASLCSPRFLKTSRRPADPVTPAAATAAPLEARPALCFLSGFPAPYRLPRSFRVLLRWGEL